MQTKPVVLPPGAAMDKPSLIALGSDRTFAVRWMMGFTEMDFLRFVGSPAVRRPVLGRIGFRIVLAA